MANEQTSVPLYAASEVLTAANMNISAGTGVPVFATTVTRDAAFGGAGEKVLAEGQLCYLSASNIVQYYDGAAWATVGPTTSKIAQVVSANYNTEITVTSTSYVTSNLTATITPTLNTSKILIVVTSTNNQNTGGVAYATIFRGTVAGTNLATTADRGFSMTGAFNGAGVAMSFLDSPATTSATTYTYGLRVTTGTCYAHSNSTTSTITLTEVLV